eukprot:3956642-Pleurochrysis_carterae.AAC.1
MEWWRGCRHRQRKETRGTERRLEREKEGWGLREEGRRREREGKGKRTITSAGMWALGHARGHALRTCGRLLCPMSARTWGVGRIDISIANEVELANEISRPERAHELVLHLED